MSSSEEVQRFFLRTQLASCSWAGWSGTLRARLTGDERTAAHFERARRAMVARLTKPVAHQQPRLEEAQQGEVAAWQQLALL